jgi:hypothetical protein
MYHAGAEELDRVNRDKAAMQANVAKVCTLRIANLFAPLDSKGGCSTASQPRNLAQAQY